MHSDGYRWRNELKNKILCYIKKGIEDGFPNEKYINIFLDNLLRGYVPVFWTPKTPATNDRPWIIPFHLPDWLNKEMEIIGKEFAQIGNGLDRKEANRVRKQIFEDYEWKTEKPVCGISPLDKTGRWKYDAYKENKEKVAVEVELSNRFSVFKDAFKFLIGQAMGQIDIGVIMVRKHKEKRGQPYLGWIDPSSHPIYTTLPMLKVAFYGFPNKANEKKES